MIALQYDFLTAILDRLLGLYCGMDVLFSMELRS